MKHLIFAAMAAISFNAAAEVRFEAETTNGGSVVLTMRACSGESVLKDAYLIAPGGQTMNGCWGYFDDRIHVVWNDGSRFSYDPGHFRKRGEERKQTKKGSAI